VYARGVIGYRSTAGDGARVACFREALFAGQPPDGGLFVPERVPRLDMAALAALDLPGRARSALAAWLADELPATALDEICRDSFDFPVPLVALDARTHILELFHGPTAAFKDFGARFMARAMARLRAPGRPLVILVATSGDTGAAVAHAFAGLEATRVVLLYPAGMVSPLQEAQITAAPDNTVCIQVQGTFDDCQAMVKAALGDRDLVARLGLVSANSINVGRLLPQTVYYLHAALELAGAGGDLAGTGLELAGAGGDLARTGRDLAAAGSPPLVVVPAGNLGNLTAGLIAKRQGAPIRRFLAANNRNAALADWVVTGELRPRPAVPTPSNAMDVGSPSNAARIFDLYAGDLEALRRDVAVESIDDEATLETMRRIHQESGRFVCPHTAVALAALERHRASGIDPGPAVVLATAHAAKFEAIVRAATGQAPPPPPSLERLSRALGRPPARLPAASAALAAFLSDLG